MEKRVLIHAPTGKDARLISEILRRASVDDCVCASAEEVDAEMPRGVGVLLIVDDALEPTLMRSLCSFLSRQPTWSDLPILLMSQRGMNSLEMRSKVARLGNVTLLERPLPSLVLLSAVTSALRGRDRQYAMRGVDRRKDEFLAMLAHELRNPLAPVGAASELLKLANSDPQTVKRASEIISRQVTHMTGLIDDLLDVSRVSRGLVALEKEILEARHIVASAIEQVRPSIDQRKHHLTLQTSPMQALIKGDAKRMIQIITNVLSNASKYTPEGGEIMLSTTVDENNVTFTVIDNGIGMSADVIGGIFDMFAQAERTPDRSQGGLGIGLALVKTLVQLHDGMVTAESSGAGMGSKFTLVFPRCIESPAEAAAQHDATASPVGGLTILLVDDNYDAAETLGMLLEYSGYVVTLANNGESAVQLAKKVAFDVCLLDIGLPGMDGIELATVLRNIPATAGATLVAITGYGQVGDRRATAAAGFDHHLVKPVDIPELMTILSALV